MRYYTFTTTPIVLVAYPVMVAQLPGKTGVVRETPRTFHVLGTVVARRIIQIAERAVAFQ
jgi:hypothetical protein